MLDIIFRGAVVADGTGTPAYGADVGVKDGKIVRIGGLVREDARRTVDCKGLVLAPGFIDAHSHSDLFLAADPGCDVKLQQGVTTEVAGQCGLTIAPVPAEHYEEYVGGSMVEALCKGDRRPFTSVGKWFDFLCGRGFGTNQLAFLGQGTIRESVMGAVDGPANEEQLRRMKEIVREGMERGALGLSTGLAYAPGCFTPQEEIVELCRVVAEYGGIYVSHMRNQAGEMLACVADTIDVARKTGCRACISHIKCIGKPNWGSMPRALELLRKAREEGLEVWCDAYPYVAGSTTLTVTLPPSLLEGGKEKLLERLKKPETLDYIKAQFANPTERWENAAGENGLESFLVAIAPATPQAVGKRITQYAEELGLDPFDAYIKLLIDNETTVMTVNFVMSEEDLVAAISDGACLIGSDGGCRPGDKVTHPRSIGTFPRYLGRYARDQKLCSIEQAVAKLTGQAAERYALGTCKGYIREGYDADLVVFDWDQITDTADFTHCFGENQGIAYVVVNGEIAVEHNRCTDVRSGRWIPARTGGGR
ncbi:MAG: D-aminoacylase [Clostridia bacterium]|nr:D-aminoacylase [Clostridia bacterium]